MENRPNLPDQPAMTIYALLGTLSIELSINDFLDLLQLAMNHVKPFCVATKSKVVVGDDGMCDLGLDMKYIKAVSTNEGLFESWNTKQRLDFTDSDRTADEFSALKTDFSYSNEIVIGEFVDFKVVDKSTIKVSPILTGKEVYVLSQAPVLGDDGLPLFTMAQVEALMYQVALLYAQKQMFKGCNNLDIKFLMDRASRKTAQARVPDYISDNEWDAILDVKTSFDRKSYNKNFKSVR